MGPHSFLELDREEGVWKVKFLHEEIRLRKKEAQTKITLARIQIQKENYKGAIALLDEALKLDPTNTDALFYKGVALKNIKKLEEAIEIFTQLTRGNKRDKQAWYQMGLCHKDKRNYSFAILCFEIVLGIDKRNKKAIEKLEETRNLAKKENQKLKKILQFEYENQRDATQIELIRNVGLSMDEVPHFRKLLNSKVKLSPKEIESLKKKTQKIINELVDPHNPTLYDLVFILNLDFLEAKKIGQLLIDEGFITNFPKFPVKKPKIPATENETLSNEVQKSLVDDLESISRELSKEIINEILTEDIIEKGKEMTEVYLFLYCIENSLRLFIEKVGKDKLGDNYFEQIKIKKEITKNVEIRKKEESKNKWMRLRGDSDIFYLDFEDLGHVIENNWDLFKQYFPRLDWIVPKIREMAKIRHFVAHNSYIGTSERDLMKIYYKVILKQISDTMNSTNDNLN